MSMLVWGLSMLHPQRRSEGRLADRAEEEVQYHYITVVTLLVPVSHDGKSAM